jgi:hypothetical protein
MQIYLYQNVQTVGPYTDQQLRTMVASGAIKPTDLAWHEGLSAWQSLNTILPFTPTFPVPSVNAPKPPPGPKKKRSSCGGCLVLCAIVAGAVALIGGIAQNSRSLNPSLASNPAPESSTPNSIPAPSAPAVIPVNTPPQLDSNEASLAKFIRTVHDNYGMIGTIDGKEYINVTVTKVDPSGISFTSDSGIATVPFEQFAGNHPPDLKKIYGFDPALAGAYRKARSDYQAAKADADAKDQAFKAHAGAVIKSVDDSARRIGGKVLQVVNVESAHTQGYLISLNGMEDQMVVLIGTKVSWTSIHFQIAQTAMVPFTTSGQCSTPRC